MISAIHYKSFKSLIDTSLPLEPLTILIGTNSSGKTNALEGLSVLSALATGAEIGQSIERIETRGGAENCPPFGKNQFTLGCDFLSPKEMLSFGNTCRYEISVGSYQVPLITSESLLIGNVTDKEDFRKPALYTTNGEPDIQLNTIHASVDNFAKGGEKPGFYFLARISILFQLISRIKDDFEKRKYKKPALRYHQMVVNQLLSSLSSILLIDPKPDEIRWSGFISIDNKEMDSHGFNLSGVLFNICQDTGKKIQIEELLKNLPEHNILGIDFQKTSNNNKVSLSLKEQFSHSDQLTPIELLSDGTARLLTVLAAALSVNQGSLMVIEEMDTSLHPSKVGNLTTLLRQIAKERNIRLLITSHNPALLDSVPAEDLKSVVLCYREYETGYSKLVRLIDLPRLPSVLANESLGEIMRKGVLNNFLKKNEESKQQKELKFRNWLNNLELELNENGSHY